MSHTLTAQHAESGDVVVIGRFETAEAAAAHVATMDDEDSVWPEGYDAILNGAFYLDGDGFTWLPLTIPDLPALLRLQAD